MFTNYVSFTYDPTIIHLADKDLQPICGQTDGDKRRILQQSIFGPATCRRCLKLAAAIAEEPSVPAVP